MNDQVMKRLNNRHQKGKVTKSYQLDWPNMKTSKCTYACELSNWYFVKKINPLPSLRKDFIIFRPHIMGEENHDLCCVFFQTLSNLHDLHPLPDFFNSYLSILVIL